MQGWRTGLGSVPWLPGGICLAADGRGKKKKKKKAAAGSLMKSLDRRVSRVEEHNQTPDM